MQDARVGGNNLKHVPDRQRLDLVLGADYGQWAQQATCIQFALYNPVRRRVVLGHGWIDAFSCGSLRRDHF